MRRRRDREENRRAARAGADPLMTLNDPLMRSLMTPGGLFSSLAWCPTCPGSAVRLGRSGPVQRLSLAPCDPRWSPKGKRRPSSGERARARAR